MKNYLKLYLTKWWIPLSVSALLLLPCLFFINPDLYIAAILLFSLSVASLLVSSIYKFITKNRVWGIIHLLLFLGGLFVISFLYLGYIFQSFNYDDFPTKLKIPEDIEIYEPGRIDDFSQMDDPVYVKEIVRAYNFVESEDETVNTNIGDFDNIYEYLAESPYWYVSQNYDGDYFAAKRTSEINIKEEHRSTISYSLNIYPLEEEWSGEGYTIVDRGDTVSLKIVEEYKDFKTTLLIKSDNCILVIRVVAKKNISAITQSIISLLGRELENGRVNYLNGESTLFNLYNSHQGGIYNSKIWINPGEPGQIYIKAFEASRDIELSKNRLKRKSLEKVGWSENPDHLFYAGSNFTIYEGDWDHPYAGRFEIWFIPDSGGSERFLYSKNFKIVGWQF